MEKPGSRTLTDRTTTRRKTQGTCLQQIFSYQVLSARAKWTPFVSTPMSHQLPLSVPHLEAELSQSILPLFLTSSLRQPDQQSDIARRVEWGRTFMPMSFPFCRQTSNLHTRKCNINPAVCFRLRRAQLSFPPSATDRSCLLCTRSHMFVYYTSKQPHYALESKNPAGLA